MQITEGTKVGIQSSNRESRFGCSLFPGMLCGGQALGTGFFSTNQNIYEDENVDEI